MCIRDSYNYCPTVLAYDLAFLNYVRIPQILDMVAQLIGEDFALWNSSFFAKPAHARPAAPWHQDGGAYQQATDPHFILTVWLPLAAATPENGCMQLIPRVHTRGMMRHHIKQNLLTVDGV